MISVSSGRQLAVLPELLRQEYCRKLTVNIHNSYAVNLKAQVKPMISKNVGSQTSEAVAFLTLLYAFFVFLLGLLWKHEYIQMKFRWELHCLQRDQFIVALVSDSSM